MHNHFFSSYRIFFLAFDKKNVQSFYFSPSFTLVFSSSQRGRKIQPSFKHESLEWQSKSKATTFPLLLAPSTKKLGKIQIFKPSRRKKGYTIDNRHTATTNTIAKNMILIFQQEQQLHCIRTHTRMFLFYLFVYRGNYYENTHKLINRRKCEKCGK